MSSHEQSNLARSFSSKQSRTSTQRSRQNSTHTAAGVSAAFRTRINVCRDSSLSKTTCETIAARAIRPLPAGGPLDIAGCLRGEQTLDIAGCFRSPRVRCSDARDA